MRERHFGVLLGCCLVVLQGADLVLTWRLLQRPDVYEANPLARGVVARFGDAGLIGFKGICTAVVLGIVLFVWQRRAVVAKRLLCVCCLLLAGTSIWSLAMLSRQSDVASESVLLAEQAGLDRQMDEAMRFYDERLLIAEDLLAGRISLAAAVEPMARCIERYRPGLVAPVRAALPATDQPSEVSLYLISLVAMVGKHTPEGRARLAVLHKELDDRYPRSTRASVVQDGWRAEAEATRSMRSLKEGALSAAGFFQLEIQNLRSARHLDDLVVADGVRWNFVPGTQ
jgi:hypothetical protein